MFEAEAFTSDFEYQINYENASNTRSGKHWTFRRVAYPEKSGLHGHFVLSVGIGKHAKRLPDLNMRCAMCNVEDT